MPSLSFGKSKKLEAQLAELERKQRQIATQNQWQAEQRLMDEQQRHQDELKRAEDTRKEEARRYQQHQGELKRAEDARKEEAQRYQRRLDHERRLHAEQEANDRVLLEQERRLRVEQEAKDRKLRAEQEAIRQADLLNQRNLRIEQEFKERIEREQEQERHDRKMQKLRMTTPDALRNLRDLIRRKYELDVAIWADRKVRRPDRPFVVANMERADAVLEEIGNIVGTWGEDNRDGMWKDHEWQLAQEIYLKLHEDGKRWWRDNPPWEEN
jgi:hypothetical protein